MSIIVSLLWKAAFKAAVKARQQFGEEHVYIQRFEDLIEQPESSVKSLADWLDLDFQPAMLEKIALINSLDNTADSQDATNKAGFVKQAAYRWREQLDRGEIAAIQSCCGKLIEQAGYQRELIELQDWLTIAGLWINLPFTSVRAVLANRDRMGNVFNYIWKRFNLGV